MLRSSRARPTWPPAKVQTLAGRDDISAARDHGIRVVFKRKGDDAVITAVAAES